MLPGRGFATMQKSVVRDVVDGGHRNEHRELGILSHSRN